MSQLVPSTTPNREFRGHIHTIRAVAVSPDGRRMITGSEGGRLRLWDLKTGAVLKMMEGHRSGVSTLAVSRDGKLIASGGGGSGEFITWHGETGALNQVIKVNSRWIINALDFSPDGKVLTVGSTSHDTVSATALHWSTITRQSEGNPLQCSGWIYDVRYSPLGEFLAIATGGNIEIYNPGRMEHIASFKGHAAQNTSLAWTPDDTRFFTAGGEKDPTIREWDTSTWVQVGDPWMRHNDVITAIAINSAGTLVASASLDKDVCLWRLSDRQIIAIFQHSAKLRCVTFSTDGKHILSGGDDHMISEWEVPKDTWPKEAPSKSVSKVDTDVCNPKIFTINATARNACITGDLSAAEQLFTQEINIDVNNFTSYVNRSLIMARLHDWDRAFDDAIKSVTIQPSLAGYISKGIALCGRGQVRDARIAFDLAFMFTKEDSTTAHFLLLIKVIALFNAYQHDEAVLLVQQLAVTCPNNDTLACRVVETYLCVQLGINASNGARHDEAVDHFTAAVNSSTFSSTFDIHSIYEDLVVLFGWDLKSLWKDARQKRCDALYRAGRLEEALESYRSMMDIIDDNTKARCLDWSNGFRQAYTTLHLTNGDAALAARDYDTAIESYSVVIELSSARDSIFANRSKARLQKMLWEDALLDAHKVIELNPSSYVGHQLKYTAFHGLQRYNEAIEAFQRMLTKLDISPNTETRKLREQYLSPSHAGRAIQRVVDAQLNTAPLRLLDTATGRLCDREAQISTFRTSTEYNELLLSIMEHPDLRVERLAEVVATYFHFVMLSHRWEGTEPLLHDIKDKVVYELKAAGGLVKLQSFCNIVHSRTEYHWAWVDSCCIDQMNHVELQTSLDSMFAWYRNSALTIVYLSDVLSSSKSGALAKSAWNTRGWTVPEFLAPKVILFYQQDWTIYLDDGSLNHKESVEIMDELEDATGIDAGALVAFQPGMKDAREKLQWASTRVTTRPEDIAYSLFGIFGVRLPIHYGENKQHALGRLLQEIVAHSGDITALDWVGQPSTFNSCLPADISSYAAPPCILPSLSEDEIQTAVSSLFHTVAVDLASKLYDHLDTLSAPRFGNCRLHLPCIIFRVTEVRRRTQESPFTYGVKANGLRDLPITTEETLIQFSRTRPTRQTFLLVFPWDRRLLELPDFTDDVESLGDWSEHESPLDHSPGASPVEEELANSESHSRALRLIVRLGQPFSAFLLAQQRGGEYRRIASDHDIIAQVNDVASVHSMMDVRTLEIL